MVPTFTKTSIGQVGAQLYPDSIATVTPQPFTVAFSPLELDGVEVDPPPRWRRLTRCRPAQIRQVRAGFAITGLQPLDHFRYTF
jgi:hypothetical protein